MPVVDGSVPVLERGRSSARRNPVCTLFADGAKIETSLSSVSYALLA
jgi:hypothetical protein